MDERLQEVKASYDNGDAGLGLRRLIDAVWDSQDAAISRRLLSFIEHSEQSGAADPVELNAILDILTGFPFEASGKTGKLLLEAVNLSKTYRNSHFRIGPLDFTVRYSEVTGLVGENGNGKTTLLRLLCKDLEPDSGSLRFTDMAVSKTLYGLRSGLVYIPQRVPRWYGSLMDNLHFTLSAYGVYGDNNYLKAELMLARLGLRPFRDLGWGRISSGYRTRFELAKSLMRKPELMLLDEPLSNLDIISQQTILKDLKYMSESITNPFGLVLSSQQLYEVEKISDLVIFLKQGNPKYSRGAAGSDQEDALVFEMDGELSRERLFAVFRDAGLEQVQYNGGVYVLHFKKGSRDAEVFGRISTHALPVSYVRNITHSSRRFFIQ